VLLARLRALLRRGATPRATTLEAAGIRLDPASRRVEVDGSVVALSRREFLVLEHLLRAHPTVVSKESLLDNVWGPEDAGANIVEVYIGYLRRKLGRDRIETVRGVGYRLRA
jgi:DNA-binding response OmpR family regulator